MPTNEFQITDRAVAALGSAIDDIIVSGYTTKVEMTPDEMARAALEAVAADGWELLCHNELKVEDGSATLAPAEFNVMDHFAKRIAAHGD